MDWKKELGNQLRDGRTDLLLLQDAVAKEAQLHKNMISRYENGVSGPELDVLIRLAAILDIQEFRIGNYFVNIRAVDDTVAGNNSQLSPKQLRLKYGGEYVFDSNGSSMKIQPTKEGLFIASAREKSAG